MESNKLSRKNSPTKKSKELELQDLSSRKIKVTNEIEMTKNDEEGENEPVLDK